MGELMFKSVKLFLVLVYVIAPIYLLSQDISEQTKPKLTIEQIMQDPKWTGEISSTIWWSEDGKQVYFKWNPGDAEAESTYVVNRDGNGLRKLTLEERKNLIPKKGEYNKDRTKKVYLKESDIFLLDIPSMNIQQITNTTERESFPSFSHDEKKILFVRNSNLFSIELESGLLTQLTDFRQGNKPKDKSKTDREKWLEKEELSLIQTLKERKVEKENRKKEEALLTTKRPKEIYVGNKSVDNIFLSPNNDFITFITIEYPSDNKYTKVPNYITESGYTEDITARAKVGSPETKYELGVYDINNDTVYFVDRKQIPGIYDKPDFKRENDEDKYDEPREVYYYGPFYSTDGKHSYVLIRSMDNKDRWLMHFIPSNATLTLLDRQRDEAWIGAPGISGYKSGDTHHGWLPDSKHIWFQSEETGYSHLYTINVETGKKKQLTEGNFEITGTARSNAAGTGPTISNDGKWWYFVSSEVSPFVRDFYRMPIDGGKRERITSHHGNHQVFISPDQSMLAVRYSESNKPWQLYLMENKPGSEMKQITFGGTDEFHSYPWIKPEIVWFDAENGKKVPARIYEPLQENKNGAAVIFVHGAGYLQNVHDWWSSYSREYMFHHLLADEGYTVLDIDYRGSAGYGRDWRTDIYRHMGGKDLSDQVDGAKFLIENYNIALDKIGIYGGSYGGFIVLMAMFNQPDVFKSGAALRAVTDWAHYNHPYTANILNTPQEDTLSYKKSSPIYFAEGLQGHLLICH
ncbi:MAG TPA: S9 family peptidase, partial [Ignavibacteria bacterium]|nr:S9 family peptidase [Ignavibacteria bacterium]